MIKLTAVTALSLAIAGTANAQTLNHRKADLNIVVQSTDGFPLAGALVEVEMLDHAFRFGCAVEERHINPNSSEYDPATVENLQKYFNSTTYGNAMKWRYVEGRSDADNLALAALPQTLSAFDGPSSLRLRGHATLWGSNYQLPDDLQEDQVPTQEYTENRILEHIETYHTLFMGSGIDGFDLYNEPFHERALLIERVADEVAGLEGEAEIIANWFNTAKQVDEDSTLFINEYNILNFWDSNDADIYAYKQLIDTIRGLGGQIDGIGLQAHMDRPTTTKEDITRRLDILSAPMEPSFLYPNGLEGLPIEITELDLNIANEAYNNPSWQNPTMEQQVAVAEAVITAAFEHEAVTGITVWGMNDSTHWRGNAMMFDDSDPENWEIKDTGQLWIDKVLGDWWADHSGTTALNGEYSASTFKGTHRVTVNFNGEISEQIVDLDDSETLTFNFTATADDAAEYDSWALLFDWQSDSSTRLADPDHDGRNNLKEFVFGSNPLIADAIPSPTILYSENSDDILLYSVRARNEGLAIRVEKSNDLENWIPVQGALGSVSVSDGIALRTLEFPESDLEPSGEEEAIFYRVRAEEI